MRMTFDKRMDKRLRAAITFRSLREAGDIVRRAKWIFVCPGLHRFAESSRARVAGRLGGEPANRFLRRFASPRARDRLQTGITLRFGQLREPLNPLIGVANIIRADVFERGLN